MMPIDSPYLHYAVWEGHHHFMVLSWVQALREDQVLSLGGAEDYLVIYALICSNILF